MWIKAIQEIDNVEGLLLALVKMGLILAYFYVCDRTNFFMKENKYVIISVFNSSFITNPAFNVGF